MNELGRDLYPMCIPPKFWLWSGKNCTQEMVHHLTMMTSAGWSMSEVSNAMCMSLVIPSIVMYCATACYVDATKYWAASFTTKWCTRLHVSKRINTDLWFVWYWFIIFYSCCCLPSYQRINCVQVFETAVGDIHSCNMNSPIWWTLKWYIHFQCRIGLPPEDTKLSTRNAWLRSQETRPHWRSK